MKYLPWQTELGLNDTTPEVRGVINCYHRIIESFRLEKMLKSTESMQADLGGGMWWKHANKSYFSDTFKRPRYHRFLEITAHGSHCSKHVGLRYHTVLVQILRSITAVKCLKAVNYSNPNRRKWRQQQAFSQWIDHESCMSAISQSWKDLYAFDMWEARESQICNISVLTGWIWDWDLREKQRGKRKGYAHRGFLILSINTFSIH